MGLRSPGTLGWLNLVEDGQYLQILIAAERVPFSGFGSATER